MKQGEQTVERVDPGALVPHLTAGVWQEMQKVRVGKCTGEVTFDGGKLLYVGPMKNSVTPSWSLEEPANSPEGFRGPFRMEPRAWEQISGGGPWWRAAS